MIPVFNIESFFAPPKPWNIKLSPTKVYESILITALSIFVSAPGSVIVNESPITIESVNSVYV